MTCSNCGTANKPAYRFCANCGNTLAAKPDEGIRGQRIQRATATADKKPVGMAIASFFVPGLGHFLKGDTKKGGLLLGGAVLLVLTGIGYFLVGIYAAYDIYKQGA